MTRRPRRTSALSKEQIVEASLELLDNEGEAALTFRALAKRLSTGAGALYWHVSDKDELLQAAAELVVTRLLQGLTPDQPPAQAIRELTDRLFGAITTHPWLGTQLLRKPWQTAVSRLFESVGQQLDRLGVAPEAQFDAASTLVSYLLGLAAQYAAGARLLTHRSSPADFSRADFLGAAAEQWAQLDPAEYPFMRRVAEQMARHDDRQQFLAGIDLILEGLERQKTPGP